MGFTTSYPLLKAAIFLSISRGILFLKTLRMHSLSNEEIEERAPSKTLFSAIGSPTSNAIFSASIQIISAFASLSNSHNEQVLLFELILSPYKT